jgi:hypothetical protein
MFKLGDTDRAIRAFSRIVEIYGRKGFAGDLKAYLKYLDEQRTRQISGGT